MIRPRSPPIEEYPEAHLGAWKGICFQVEIHSLRCRWLVLSLPKRGLPNSRKGVDEIPPDDVPIIVNE